MPNHIIARINNRLERSNSELNAAFSTPHPTLRRFVSTTEEISCRRVQFLVNIPTIMLVVAIIQSFTDPIRSARPTEQSLTRIATLSPFPIILIQMGAKELKPKTWVTTNKINCTATMRATRAPTVMRGQTAIRVPQLFSTPTLLHSWV